MHYTEFYRLEELSEARRSNHAAHYSAEPCTCNATFDPHVATNGINGDLTPIVCERRGITSAARAVRGQFQRCFVMMAYAQLAIATLLTARDSPGVV